MVKEIVVGWVAFRSCLLHLINDQCPIFRMKPAQNTGTLPSNGGKQSTVISAVIVKGFHFLNWMLNTHKEIMALAKTLTSSLCQISFSYQSSNLSKHLSAFTLKISYDPTFRILWGQKVQKLIIFCEKKFLRMSILTNGPLSLQLCSLVQGSLTTENILLNTPSKPSRIFYLYRKDHSSF